MSLLCFVFLFLLTTILFISNSSFCTFPVGCTGADSRDCSRRGLAHGRRSKRKGGATEVGAEGESFVFLYFLHSLMLPYLFRPNFLCCLFNLIQVNKQYTITNHQEQKVSLLCFIFLFSLTLQLQILLILSSSFLYSSSWLFGRGRPRGRRPRRKSGADMMNKRRVFCFVASSF